MKILRSVWRAARPLLLVLAAIVLFVEEWGWRPLTALAAKVARWPPIARFENLLRRAPPKVALALFLVPAALLFPIKLAALWFMHEGHVAFGLFVILAAKVIGTAAVGRLFIVVEPQLMQFGWFVRALAWSRLMRRRVMARLHASAPWRIARVAARRWRMRWRHFSRS
jgi:hypothetical protein